MSRRSLILLLAFLGLVNGLTLWFVINQTATQNSLIETALNSCSRVNVLRAQSNLSNITSFKVLAKAHLPYYATELFVTGMTDCKAALDQDGNYRYPIAEPIGNPRTGTLSAKAAQIEAESLVARSSVFVKNTK